MISSYPNPIRQSVGQGHLIGGERNCLEAGHSSRGIRIDGHPVRRAASQPVSVSSELSQKSGNARAIFLMLPPYWGDRSTEGVEYAPVDDHHKPFPLAVGATHCRYRRAPGVLSRNGLGDRVFLLLNDLLHEFPVYIRSGD